MMRVATKTSELGMGMGCIGWCFVGSCIHRLWSGCLGIDCVHSVDREYIQNSFML
jgi:hypothetical protein